MKWFAPVSNFNASVTHAALTNALVDAIAGIIFLTTPIVR
jgi:hypothetical protein